MAQGFNVGPSKTHADRDIIAQPGRRIAGKPTPWTVYHAPANGNAMLAAMLIDTTSETFPDRKTAVAHAESLVDRPELGPRWTREG